MINPPVAVVKLFLMSSIEGLLLFLGEHTIIISVGILLSDQGLALDMITGIHNSVHHAGEIKRGTAHYVS